MSDLTGKRIVVTGASSGIGAAVAKAALRSGASVLLVARDQGRLTDAAAAARDATSAILSIDVGDPDAPATIVDRARTTLGGIDAIVHAAGVFDPLPVEDTTSDVLDRHYEINVRAPFLLTRAAVQDLEGHGVVVFMSSVAGHTGFAECSAYAASKGAIEMIVRSLAAELGPRGIRVNAVAPGWVRSPMNESFLADEEYSRIQLEAISLGRFGAPEDVAELIVFMLSDRSSYIHGATVRIDGGFPAPPP